MISEDFNSPSDSNIDELFPAVDFAKVALDSANVGIWILDAATRKFQPSARTKILFGYLPGEDMSLEDALLKITDKHRRSVITTIENTIKLRGSIYLECPVFAAASNSKQRWLSITGGFSTTDLQSNYFSGIVVDITEQKQNDLRRSKFIGMVSHELKTPLTALKAYVQMLNNWAKKQKDNFSIGALSKVEKQVKKMLNMINSLLNLSGAEAGKIHLNKQKFDMDEVINEVIEETMFLTSSHNISFLPSSPIVVEADRDKIEQVLVNLLSNAAKYSGNDKPIEIACSRDENALTVSIRDQGMGINTSDIEKLFLPHYRAKTQETEKIAGFGIGLYLCSEIIQRHHGRIWVESEPGTGSNFRFTLPLN